ncbi:hypothetical protein C6W19_06650 [Bacillus sp. RJGP41]|nr:hypothetical protein C6W19_06650 [Bacillus sp. RJGP41]
MISTSCTRFPGAGGSLLGAPAGSPMFFPVLLNGWKKYATLLPNNWLAETPQAFALMWLGSQSAERDRVSEIKWNF